LELPTAPPAVGSVFDIVSLSRFARHIGVIVAFRYRKCRFRNVRAASPGFSNGKKARNKPETAQNRPFSPVPAKSAFRHRQRSVQTSLITVTNYGDTNYGDTV
jgi:hypothetical protein